MLSKGYRPKSLTDRENYGLTAPELVEYLRGRGHRVPLQLLKQCTGWPDDINDADDE